MKRKRNNSPQSYRKEFECYQRHIVKVAEDLGYDESVKEKIMNATTPDQISSIMHNARTEEDSGVCDCYYNSFVRGRGVLSHV